ncbi:hypothetical protein P885DRAFT_80881 [Corynascus similis CBS 632.67]
MCFGDGYTGVEDNNLMHYVSDIDEAFTLLQCGFNRFNSRNSDGKLAINSLTEQCDPALIKFCIENGTDITNEDSQGRTILFDLFCHLNWGTIHNGKMWAILDAVRLCLDGGVDIFEKDHCRCPCSPGGCTIFSIFSINFPSLEIPALKLGPLWSLEWVTLVEEHCGEEAARQVLPILLRRAKCDQPDIYINHVCCHRGRGIDERQVWQEQPRPLLDEDITEILDEEREFIDILEAEIDALDSNSFQCLRSRWILTLKEKYHAHVEAVNQVKGKRKLQHPEKHHDQTYVDYKNDTYHERTIYVNCGPWPVLMMEQLALYAFWLRYEFETADESAFRQLRPGGWFNRRLSWLKELMDVMEISADGITKEMKRYYEQKKVTGEVGYEELDLEFLLRM